MTPFNMCGVSQSAQPQLEIPAGLCKGGGGMHRKAVTAHTRPFWTDTYELPGNIETFEIPQEKNVHSSKVCLLACLQL